MTVLGFSLRPAMAWAATAIDISLAWLRLTNLSVAIVCRAPGGRAVGHLCSHAGGAPERAR